MSETVRIWRIFTLENGKSNMEPLDVPMENVPNGSSSKILNGKGVQFRVFTHDMQAEWPTASRRQLLTTISGEGEVETGDGQKLHLKPGVITLVEDLTGIGHLTRGKGREDRLFMALSLNDDTKLV